MSFLDILHLALRNLRQAKLRATLTTMGVIVGVAVIVTMVSFGLGLQRNMLSRFRALDLFKLKPRNRQLPTTEPKPRLLRLTVTGQTIGISIGDGSA